MNLADELLKKPARARQLIDDFSLEDAPDRFFELHPGTYKKNGMIVCENELLMLNVKQLTRLLDHPKAKLDYAEASWLYERIKERTPELNENCIVVSPEYVWVKNKSELIPVSSIQNMLSTNNRTTIERLSEERGNSSRVE